MILLYILVYGMVAAGCIFALLIGANAWTGLERPWVYVLCGCLWPVAALPAAGYIAAGWYINRKEAKEDGTEKCDAH